MAMWRLTISGHRLQQRKVAKFAAELGKSIGAMVSNIEDASPPESRPDRFRALISQVEDAQSEAEALRDELQEWRDNLPENLESSNKADELDEAISNLDDLVSNLEEAAGADVDFPSMFG